MNSITHEQLKKLHTLLSQQGMMDYKKELVYEFSGHRTDSSKQLTLIEARELIMHLAENDPCNKMRRKIIAICYKIGMIYGSTQADKKINMAVINSFLLKRGYLKKPLNDYSRSELPKLVTQFEQVLKHNQKSFERKALSEVEKDPEVELELKKVLYELGIKIAST
jgi:hypothetical protein